MRFSKNFEVRNIFGHKPSGSVVFNTGDQRNPQKKHPPTINHPTKPGTPATTFGELNPNETNTGPAVSAAEGSPINGEWTQETNYKGYPIETRKGRDGSGTTYQLRVGGSSQVVAGVTFQTRESAIARGKQIVDTWESGTVPSAPTGNNVKDDGTLRNGGEGSGVRGHITESHAKAKEYAAKHGAHWIPSERGTSGYGIVAPDKMKAFRMDMKTIGLEDHGSGGLTAPRGDGAIQRFFYDNKQPMIPNSVHPICAVMNAGTKAGFKKAEETKSATGAKSNADAATHYKSEAQKHASGRFVKGRKPDLEKASRFAHLATGCAVCADASAKHADTDAAYDHAIRAHQAAADAHKASRGGAKGDHGSPGRSKEASHLKSIEELKGLKATISTGDDKTKKKD